MFLFPRLYALEDNSDGGQGGVGSLEHISVNERLAAYESWQGNSSSSEDEYDEVCDNGEDEVKSNEGDAQYVELDDDFEEFMSAPLAPMPQQEGDFVQPPVVPPVVVTAKEHKHSEADKDETISEPIPELLPRDRLAPLTAEKIEKIKKTMEGLNFKRTGPIAGIATKLQGQRIGDEIAN